jgi:glycosyltransferase involved in cell wall biosynthesis
MGHRAKVAALLREADAFALPSLTEGLPNAVMEAMAMGLPVVATAVGGVPELVVDGETGMLVAPASPRALAEGLSELLRAAPHERQRMGEAGRERVERHFGFEAQSRKLEALYNDVVHRRRPLLAGSP